MVHRSTFSKSTNAESGNVDEDTDRVNMIETLRLELNRITQVDRNKRNNKIGRIDDLKSNKRIDGAEEQLGSTGSPRTDGREIRRS